YRVPYRSSEEGRNVAIALTCRCGNQFTVHDKFAGKRYPCPACAEVLQVPRRAARDQAVRGGAPAARPRSAKPPQPADEPAASPVHRYVWLWLGIAAVVPVAVVTIAFGL